MIVHIVLKKTEAEPTPVLFTSATDAVAYFNGLDVPDDFTIVAVEM